MSGGLSAKARLQELGVHAERLRAGVYVIAVVGDLDSPSLSRLEQVLDRVSDEDGSVVVDLSQCPYIDSTGLSVLVGTSKRLAGSGRSVALVSSDRDLRRLLELTCLSKSLKLHRTRADALAVCA
jgi:anti-sigma B factor antagonist